MPNMNDKIGGKDQLDIGMIITAPTKDKEWFKKCLVMGLLMLIPFAGALNLSGWMRTIAERRMAGGEDMNTLPDANLDYMGAGWRMFLAYLPMLGIMMLVMMVGGICAAVATQVGGRHGGEQVAVAIVVVMYLGIIAMALAMSVVGPAITFLHIVEGEAWSSVQFKRIWDVMKRGGVQYLLLFVAMLVAGMIAQLGVFACYFGMFVSIPFAQAMGGAAIAEYARLVKPVDPSFPVEGGTGGSSGAPFGVKL